MSQLKSALAAFRRILSIDISATQDDHIDLRWLSDQIKNMTPGALDVAIERSRQISEKGYDQTHDDAERKNGSLINLAISCLVASEPSRKNIKRAASLLVAEYDRLGRIEAAGK